MHGYVMFVLGISESTIDAIHIISYHAFSEKKKKRNEKQEQKEEARL